MIVNQILFSLTALASSQSAKEICTANLKKIGKAIEAYKIEHGDVPDWLSDLYPDYLQDANILICPADTAGGTPLYYTTIDPKMPCSYLYEFNANTEGIGIFLPAKMPAKMTWKKAKKLQLKYFGGVVPIIQCRHHSPFLCLSYDGEIYENQGLWETSAKGLDGLLNRLKEAVESNPAGWAGEYDMQVFVSILTKSNRIADLAELLKTHIEEHPDDESAAKMLKMAEPYQLKSTTIPEKYLEILDALWTSLNEIYPVLEYKGVYGDEWIEEFRKRVMKAENNLEFYGMLEELMASLHDTHTRLVSYPGQPPSVVPPVELNEVDDKIIVLKARQEDGLSLGDEVTTVDGQPVREALAEALLKTCGSTHRARIRGACRRMLGGEHGSQVQLTLRDAGGNEKTVQLSRDEGGELWHEPVISSRKLPSCIGYIRISRWSSSKERELVSAFDAALEEFKDVPGLILDVRGNGGGSDALADEVNGRFIENPVLSSIDFWRQSGTDDFTKGIGWVKPRGWCYKGRVAALIDEGCTSACEHFVSGLEAMGNVLLVGMPTNGAGGGPTNVTLPDGAVVRISRALGCRANGIVFEGHGIPPHIYRPLTQDDIRNGRDAALEAAVKWILSNEELPVRNQSLP